MGGTGDHAQWKNQTQDDKHPITSGAQNADFIEVDAIMLLTEQSKVMM